MKIERVLLENFGKFGSREFRFDGHPLVLIYGANETGKTTALNGLRQALFGFPHKSAYISGRVIAEATLTLSDGRVVSFVRQKKKSDGFQGQIDGTIPITESDWQGMLGGLDMKSYQSLFGFSLDELRSGEKALAHAPIEQALTSTGLGGLSHLQKIQQQIDEYLSTSLKRMGTNGIINAKLAEIEATEHELKQVIVEPAQIEALRSRIETLQTERSRLQSQQQLLREQLNSVKRQQDALPRAVELRQVEQSLEQLALPECIDDKFSVTWSMTQSRLSGARSELALETRKLQGMHDRFNALDKPTLSPAQIERCVELSQQARQAEQLQKQIEQQELELADLTQELDESLRQLGIEGSQSSWQDWKIDLAQKADLDTQSDAYRRATEQLGQCITRIDVAEKQLRMHTRPASASAIDASQLAELESALRELRPMHQNHDQLVKRVNQLKQDVRARRQAEQLLAATRGMLPATSNVDRQTFVLNDNWNLPTLAELTRVQQQLVMAERDLQQVREEFRGLEEQLSALSQDVEQSRLGSGLKSLADLESIWRKRDQVITEWREELRTPLLAPQVTPSEYESRLARLQKLNLQADNAVCEMLAAVDRLAALAARQRQMDELVRQRDELSPKLREAESQHASAKEQWQRLWNDVPFQPGHTDAVSTWLDEYRHWQQHQAQIRELEDELASIRKQRDQLLAQVRERVPAERDTWNTVSELEQHVVRARSEMVTASTQAKMIREVESTRQVATAERVRLESSLTEIQAEWERQIAQLGLPVDWPISEFPNRLATLQRCQVAAGRITAMRKRLTADRLNLTQFISQCEAHARSISQPVESRDVLRIALGWQQWRHSLPVSNSNATS